MKRIWPFLILTTLLGCKTDPVFESRRPQSIIIAGYPFQKRVSKDTYGSAWKLVDIRPSQLPYTGDITKMSAQERWSEILKVLRASIEEVCKGPADGEPEFRADETDFSKLGTSPESPQFGQVKFKCK